MYKVDRYQRSGYLHDIYLTYKEAPLTLRGQSLTNEWQNGKRICNKKIKKEDIVIDLKEWLEHNVHNRPYEYRRITSRRKTKRIRLAAKRTPSVKGKCRKEVSWLTPNAKIKKKELKPGLFKVREVKNGYRTNWQTIYVRTVREESGKITVKDVTFK